MIRTMQKIRAASILALFAAVIFGLAAGDCLAGQQRAAIIPPRLQKVKEGDWVLIRSGEGLIKETATGIVEIEADPKEGIEPMYMVEYTLEKFDGETGKALEKPMKVARALEHEIEENAETIATMKGKPERRKATIDGKALNIVVVPQEEEGAKIENWYSDDVGIDGRVAIVVISPDMDPYRSLEVVAFGNAKTQLNIKKYLQKKQ